MYKIDSKIDKPDFEYLYSRITQMMKRGIKVGNLENTLKLFSAEQLAFRKDILTNYGIENPNSSKQVTGFIQTIEDPKVIDICYKNGKWTSNKKAMQAVSNLGYEFAGLLIQFRTAKKYSENVAKLIEYRDSNSMIHPQVSRTKTNRVSYSNPALMNIPKALLWYLVHPTEETSKLYSVDIKNQEPSIMINALNIESLKQAIRSPNGLYEEMFRKIPIKCHINIIVTDNEEPGVIDNSEMAMHKNIPYRYYSPKAPEVPSVYIENQETKKLELVKYIDIINIASPLGVIPKLPEEVAVESVDGTVKMVHINITADLGTKANKQTLANGGIVEIEGTLDPDELTITCTGGIRSEFKTAWNAMTYGASIVGIREMCNLLDGDTVYRYFSKIPELAKYREACSKMAGAKMFESKTFFNTLIQIARSDEMRLKRIHMDVPIQGTAADILALLVKHFDSEVKARGLQGKLEIYYTRHDELIIEANAEMLKKYSDQEITDILRDILEHQVDNWIPFKVEIDQVKSIDPMSLIITTDDEEDEE